MGRLLLLGCGDAKRCWEKCAENGVNLPATSCQPLSRYGSYQFFRADICRQQQRDADLLRPSEINGIIELRVRICIFIYFILSYATQSYSIPQKTFYVETRIIFVIFDCHLFGFSIVALQ